jgi:hypothetical protein
MMGRIRMAVIWLLAVLFFQVGCSGHESVLMNALDGPEVLPGWVSSGDRQVFDAESLYELVNGQADAFFAYAFEQVGVENYVNGGGTLRLEVWQLATPADAYGLFSSYRSGAPISIGHEGDGDPGRRLDFWQDRFFVRVFAPQLIPDEELRVFAEVVADALPASQSTQYSAGGGRPVLVERLPRDGLLERSDIFFHQEVSIQNYVWLGGQNLLGLSAETDGLLARYETEAGMAYLLLVQYPELEAAQSGLEDLQDGSIADLVAAQVRGDLLGAVFGMASETEAHTLLTGALAVQ